MTFFSIDLETELKLDYIKNWDKYLELRPLPTLDLPQSCLAFNNLSFPLTLVSCYSLLLDQSLEDFPHKSWESVQSLTFHVIVTSLWMEETLFLIKYEEILHLIPSLKLIHLVFIGLYSDEELQQRNSLKSELQCQFCKQRNKKLYFSYWTPKIYEGFWNSPSFQTADSFVAFNLTPECFTNNSPHPCISSLRFGLEKKIPFIITCKKESDTKLILQFFINSNSLIIQPPIQNPFRGYQPFLDPTSVDKFASFNQYFLIAK